ncbi:MAG: urea ABC transporter ATP-binding protein UrtD [SAR202 cluster bacterium]|nr:urea ABC transporter ATP-binding protein UrtD [SAR202 cluster bacterium]
MISIFPKKPSSSPSAVRASPAGSGPILSAEKLTVSFDGFTVLDALDFSLDRGEMRFLIGPNGAGKTTLIDVITGKTKPSRGRVIFDGWIDLARRQEHDLVRLGIGRKFQTPSVFGSLSVFQNLEVALGFRSSLGAQLKSLGAQDADRIGATLEQVSLTEQVNQRAGTLSHGQKQWLEIGMLLVQDPKLLLLDEPVAGMTRRERDRTGELLQRIVQDRSVLVVEHDMQFVRQLARKVTVMHMGKVLSEGSMEDVQQDPQVIKAYLGHGKQRPVKAEGEPEPAAGTSSTSLASSHRSSASATA